MFRPLVVTLLLSLPLAQVPASAAGVADAQYLLGRSLAISNPAEAARWYRKAADQGQSRAQSALGFAYYKGEGIAKDETQAASLFRKAAEQGEQLAQWMLASMYLEGRGVQANEEEALKWYEAVIAVDAADGKSGRHPMTEMAKPQIAMIYSRRSMIHDAGFGVTKDPALGYYWLSRSAQLDPEIQAKYLPSRAKDLSPEQRANAERQILEWAMAPGHGGVEGFAPALAALHAAAKIPQVPDPKKDH